MQRRCFVCKEVERYNVASQRRAGLRLTRHLAYRTFFNRDSLGRLIGGDRMRVTGAA
jgi:hypothetical protein